MDKYAEMMKPNLSRDLLLLMCTEYDTLAISRGDELSVTEFLFRLIFCFTSLFCPWETENSYNFFRANQQKTSINFFL